MVGAVLDLICLAWPTRPAAADPPVLIHLHRWTGSPKSLPESCFPHFLHVQLALSWFKAPFQAQCRPAVDQNSPGTPLLDTLVVLNLEVAELFAWGSFSQGSCCTEPALKAEQRPGSGAGCTSPRLSLQTRQQNHLPSFPSCK